MKRLCFNTCSSCEEQLSERVRLLPPLLVSIPAPLARSNIVGLGYPRASTFQYLLLLRGATRLCQCHFRFRLRFNTCSSCEEQHGKIAIVNIKDKAFQYLLLLRGATYVSFGTKCKKSVSIPAPLARSNKSVDTASVRKPFQYLLLLRGATLCHCQYEKDVMFQYLLLLRGATARYGNAVWRRAVSIPAPLARSNHGKLISRRAHPQVSIPAPLARSNTQRRKLCAGICVSIPAPLARSNLKTSSQAAASRTFQYLLLLRGATNLSQYNAVYNFRFQYLLLLRGATRRKRQSYQG